MTRAKARQERADLRDSERVDHGLVQLGRGHALERGTIQVPDCEKPGSVAAHGLLPTDLVCQTEAAIVTSPLPGAKDAGGALLNASQIATLDLDANLVILSACNSGGPGGKAEGEALTGLALSFFSAGARSLLVTHWSVNDRVTAYLVANLVQKMNTKRAEGVTGALREVALEMLDKAGKDLPAEIQHPFYWAPFAVIGDGLERVSAQPLRTASR